MTLDDLRGLLKQIDPIELAGLLQGAQAVLSDSDGLGRQALQQARTIKILAGQFLSLRRQATTAEAQAVFDRRMQTVIDQVTADVNLTVEEKQIIQPFIAALLA